MGIKIFYCCYFTEARSFLPFVAKLRELQYWAETVKLIGILTDGKKGSAMPFGGFIWAILLTVDVDGILILIHQFYYISSAVRT